MVQYTEWRSISDGSIISSIPDTGLDHLWYGPEISDVSTWPDSEGSLDASASGSPTLSDINGVQAVDYDASDYHQTDDPAPFGNDNVWTAVAVVEPTDTDSREPVLENGDDNGFRLAIDFDASDYRVIHNGEEAVAAGSPITDPQVIVATYDGSSTIMDVNKNEQINTSINPPTTPTGAVDIAFSTSLPTDFEGADYEGVTGAAGVEAAAADSNRRDELADLFADAFNIDLS